MAVVITSTTSTKEEMEHAASDNWREPYTPPEAPPVERTPSEIEGESGTPPPQEKKTNGWQKRVDKLTARNKALEADVRQLQERIARAEKNPSATTPPATEMNGQPKRTDFKTDEEYIAALTKHALAIEKAKEAEEEQLARLKATFDEYNGAIEEISAKYEDWDELTTRDQEIPTAVQTAIIGMGKDGPEAAYQLAKRPEECQKLMEILAERGEQAAVVEFGRFLQKITPSEPAPPKQRSAPARISPVTGSSARATIPLDQLPMKDFMRIRNQQEAERRR